MKVPETVTTRMTAADTRMAKCGVRKRGWVAFRKPGSCPCSANANSTRGAASMMMLSVPAVEMMTPRVMSKPPVAPQKFRPASARGRSEFPRPGKVPMQTNWIKIKRRAVKATADKRAKGKLRPGSLVSPDTIPAYSNPLNVKTESITAWEKDLKLVPGTIEKLANLTKNIPAA